MKILIDNGHGQSTPGKRSPDGRFLEFKFNREIAQRIVADLRDRGYDAELLVEEDDDVPPCRAIQTCKYLFSGLREGECDSGVHPCQCLRKRPGMGQSKRMVSLYEQRTNPSNLLADDLARVAMKDLGSKAVCGDWQNSDIDLDL